MGGVVGSSRLVSRGAAMGVRKKKILGFGSAVGVGSAVGMGGSAGSVRRLVYRGRDVGLQQHRRGVGSSIGVGGVGIGCCSSIGVAEAWCGCSRGVGGVGIGLAGSSVGIELA
ncbi:peroxidase-like protein 2 [Camellia sinensis]|uniref:peroxidase-like protein 2 n=1 Tax=Camellia sinensis TaxID=4442 RepID=UPI001036A799|nr:peroxidase-like protein 2 [Camellia sinensis]